MAGSRVRFARAIHIGAGGRVGRFRMSSADLVARLRELEHGGRESIGSDGLTQRYVARLLGEVGIRPTVAKVEGAPTRVYNRARFLDAWSRYAGPADDGLDDHDERTPEGGPDVDSPPRLTVRMCVPVTSQTTTGISVFTQP